MTIWAFLSGDIVLFYSGIQVLLLFGVLGSEDMFLLWWIRSGMEGYEKDRKRPIYPSAALLDPHGVPPML